MLVDLLGTVPEQIGVVWWYALMLVVDNRSRAIAIGSLARYDGKRLAWGAALQPASLWFAVVGGVEIVAGLVALAVVILPVGIARALIAPFMFVPAAELVLASLAEIVLLVAFPALLLLLLSGWCAMMDTIAEDISARRAFVRWIRWSFRRKTVVTSLIASFLYVVLGIGVTVVFSVLPHGPGAVHGLISLPDGIADTLGFVFLWHWRKVVLDRELGRDLVAALEDQALQAVPATSL